jgi:hypothetical protein
LGGGNALPSQPTGVADIVDQELLADLVGAHLGIQACGIRQSTKTTRLRFHEME